jgi:Na+/H+ antiporter NhaD/arsenite permease-like protein
MPDAMPMWWAVIIFACVYIIILTEKVDRMYLALFGGALVVATGLLEFDAAMGHIDFNVIFLLTGMMMIAHIIMKTGMFEWLAITTAKVSRGYPYRTMLLVSLSVAFVSAFLDNVTTVVLIGPIVLLICGLMEINPMPFFLMTVIFSNIGGTATLIGDPPNILIGSAAGYDFNTFGLHLTPIIVVIAAVQSVFCWIVYRKTFNITDEMRTKIIGMDASKAIKDRKLLVKSLVVLALVITGFILHGMLELKPSIIALLGATLLAAWGRVGAHDVARGVDWHTLLFFVGLFILVGAMAENGFMTLAAGFLVDLSGGNLLILCIAIIWGAGLMSGIVDNIPMAMAAIPLIMKMIPELSAQMDVSPETVAYPLWWSLALGTCLGGNLTPIGASANVVIMGFAERNGYHISFKKFMKLGVPTVIISLAISTLYIWLFYVMPIGK